MKTVLCLLLACLAVLSTMNVKAQSGKHAITAATLDWKISRSGELQYLLYVPPDYQASGTKPWPLMLFLHGAGERGSDVQKVAVHGPLKLVRHGTNFPFIIVAPQCAENRLWENGPLLQLLDQVERNYRVDRKRVYLTGLSMGGYGTWSLGLQHPERFAALVPICGGGNMIDVLLGPRGPSGRFQAPCHLGVSRREGQHRAGVRIPPPGRTAPENRRQKREVDPVPRKPITIPGPKPTTIPSFTNGCGSRCIVELPEWSRRKGIDFSRRRSVFSPALNAFLWQRKNPLN